MKLEQLERQMRKENINLKTIKITNKNIHFKCFSFIKALGFSESQENRKSGKIGSF